MLLSRFMQKSIPISHHVPIVFLLKGHWKYIFKIDFYLILFSLFPKKVLFLQKGSPGMR